MFSARGAPLAGREDTWSLPAALPAGPHRAHGYTNHFFAAEPVFFWLNCVFLGGPGAACP